MFHVKDRVGRPGNAILQNNPCIKKSSFDCNEMTSRTSGTSRALSEASALGGGPSEPRRDGERWTSPKRVEGRSWRQSSQNCSGRGSATPPILLGTIEVRRADSAPVPWVVPVRGQDRRVSTDGSSAVKALWR